MSVKTIYGGDTGVQTVDELIGNGDATDNSKFAIKVHEIGKSSRNA